MVGLSESQTVPSASEDSWPSLELRGQERWYVAQTLHHRERMAVIHLAMQGFRGFFPRFRKSIRHARKMIEVLAPVFPGYIFVVLDPERDRWRSINGTLGVARLLGSRTAPLPVPNGIVEAFVETLDFSGVVRLGGSLQPGQSVKVLSGPFAGGIGILERLDGRGRVRVLLNIMGGQAPLLIDRADLTPA